MIEEKQIEDQIKQYSELAKQNKDIDVAALMMNALQQHDQPENMLSKKTKRWAYWISLGVPPLGLVYSAYFYFFSEKEDAKHAAIVCLILTAISVGLLYLTIKIFLSTANVSVDQLQQAPDQLRTLLQP